MDTTLGRIRKVSSPDGTTDYVFEFPKTWDAVVSVMIEPGVYQAQPRVTEWEQVFIVHLIHALQR